MYKNINELKENIDKYSGVSNNSREVKDNYIFVAVRGINSDGHDFIDQAIKNGAKVVVGENPSARFVRSGLKGIEYIQVDDSREALGELASAFYGHPSKKLKVIGVTGTKGKTTTCYLIHHILTKVGKNAGLVTSIVAKIGDGEIDTGFHITSPDVISIHKLLAEMVKMGSSYAVLEVSSHGIDQGRVMEIDFEIGVLTNIAPEHLDYHKTFEEYERVKMSFINSCKYKVIAPKETNLNILPGEFNNLDAEAAIEAVEILGISKEKSLEALKSFKLPEGRLEEIENDLGIKIFVDFAHTPDSLLAALKYLRTQTSGKLIAVFGSAGERDPYKRPKMGEITGENADVVIITAEDPRSENVTDIIAQIKMGIKSENAEIFEEPDRKEAIKKALSMAKSGDLVGVFGKGHEKSMNLDGAHEIHWSDQETIREILKDED